MLVGVLLLGLGVLFTAMPEHFATQMIEFQRRHVHMNYDDRVIARTAVALRFVFGPVACVAGLLALAEALG